MRAFRLFIPVALLFTLSTSAGTLNVTADDMKATEPAIASLLGREIVRQAVLISARDGLGQSTRDGVLRENFVKGEPLIRIDITLNDKLSILLRNTRATEPIWQGTIENIPTNDHHCPIVNFVALEACEKYSRGEWVDALKKVGLTGSPNKLDPDARSADNVNSLLEKFDVISQFNAIVQSHHAIAATGESPARLCDVARGYAMLGKLTELWWSAASEVYKARALLYGQRAVSEFPDSATSYYARAIAFALSGMEQKALDDLQRAADKKQSQPTWAPLIKAYCQDDLTALTQFASQKETQPLATLLSFFSVEHLPSSSAVIGYGRIAYSANPQCIRIFDGVNLIAGVAEQHRSSLYPLGIMVTAVPDRLADFPNLPAAVTQAAAVQKKNPQDANLPSQVTHVLLQSTDPSEPSLNQLGMLIDESYWRGIMSRTEFLAFMLGSGVSQYARAVEPIVPDHPMHEVLDFYSVFETDPTSPAKMHEMQISDATLGMIRFCNYILHFQGARNVGREIWTKLLSHQDYTSFNMSFFLCLYSQNTGDEARQGRLRCAQGLLDLNPNSAIARGAMIQEGWDQVKDKAKDWEAQADHPAIAAGFAKHFLEIKQYDKAKFFFEKYLASAQDYWAYNVLADIYLQSGDEQKWLQTMQKSLQAEDTGLDHAAANEKIARHFMAKGDYKTAEPYAAASAESWASWAMKCAIDCYEGLEKWDLAEQWHINRAQRYNIALNWYIWCARTGHGHIDNARAWAQQHFTPPSDADDDGLNSAMLYSMFEKNYASAQIYATKLADKAGNPLYMMFAAACAMSQHLDASADSMFNRIITQPPKLKALADESQKIIQLAAIMKQTLNAGPDAKLDLGKIDELLGNQKTLESQRCAYFVGKFLENRRQSDDAKRYFNLAVDKTSHQDTSILARMEIVSNGQ